MNESALYLDWNASAPLTKAARLAMIDAMELDGNASSVHSHGRKARKMIEDARHMIATALKVKPVNVTFTSGASEAAAQILSPVFRLRGREISVSTLYVSAIEHPAVLNGGRFSKEAVRFIPVLESGVVDLAALEKILVNHDHSQGAALVAVQLANNETGIIQPIDKVGKIVRANNAILMVDAVQAFGKFAFTLEELDADFIILSSHKIGGPKGAGALVSADEGLMPLPLIKGGGQENFQRAGTENVIAIAGFGAAASEIKSNLEQSDEIAGLRDHIEDGLIEISAQAGNKVGDPVIFGKKEKRLANASCFAVPGIKAEKALIALDLAGISISSGSACSSGKVKKSHVLGAMGVDDGLAECALRLSMGGSTSKEDAGRFLGEWKNIVERIG